MISMTGFAARRGAGVGHAWAWDLRAVNGKGAELRLRVPDAIEGLEAALRAALQAAVTRGNVSLTLKLMPEGGSQGSAVALNRASLAAGLAALAAVEAEAGARGLALRPSSAAEILALRGILDLSAPEADSAPLRVALLADLPLLLADFAAMRQREGAALAAVIGAQLDRIAGLTAAARDALAPRGEAQAASLRDALARSLAVAGQIDATRMAQELALIAVRTDLTEELDRLAAHVAAARAHLADPGPVGRKLDFLTQELMREANTLCAKAQSLALTRIGLDLKTVIDQMREQVQNVE